eukprot:8436043-Alexandrium_andersonii.AAC.1
MGRRLAWGRPGQAESPVPTFCARAGLEATPGRPRPAPTKPLGSPGGPSGPPGRRGGRLAARWGPAG